MSGKNALLICGSRSNSYKEILRALNVILEVANQSAVTVNVTIFAPEGVCDLLQKLDDILLFKSLDIIYQSSHSINIHLYDVKSINALAISSDFVVIGADIGTDYDSQRAATIAACAVDKPVFLVDNGLLLLQELQTIWLSDAQLYCVQKTQDFPDLLLEYLKSEKEFKKNEKSEQILF